MTPDPVLRVNGERLLGDLHTLAEIGATPEGGVHRLALSAEDLRAREWFRERAAEAGLLFREDAAGNQSAVLPGPNPSASAILIGSHLDTVPHGGRFDGALGVVAALEVLRTIRETGLQLRYSLEGANFTDEEGTWRGLLGSRALAGQLTPEDVERPRGDLHAYLDGLSLAGLNPSGLGAARRDPSGIHAWVETHIEQGPRLEEAGIDIGVVTAIVGIANSWLTFRGRADHAGTTFFDRRRNALLGAARFILEAHSLVQGRFPGAVINCGAVQVEPGAFNIVPEAARVALEMRHSDAATLEKLRGALNDLARTIAGEEGLGLEVEAMDTHEPAPLDEGILRAVEGTCDRLGLSCTRLPSYAGHDTQVMASVTRAGMFFVPSVDGASHSAREFTSDRDCVNAGNVLLGAVLALALEHN